MEKKFIFGLVTAMAFIGLVGSAAETPLAAKAATGDPTPSWTYDEDQDQMVDELYDDDERRTLEGGAIDSEFSYIEANLSLTSHSPDGAIYRYSSQPEKQNGAIRFEIWLSEEVDLSKVAFSARGFAAATSVDAWSESGVPLNETQDDFGTANATIERETWTSVTINYANSFGEMAYAGHPEMLVRNGAGGFALWTTESTTGTLRIRKVEYVDAGGSSTLLDDFKHEAGTPAGAYWGGPGDGTEAVQRYVTLKDGASYKYAYGEALGFDSTVLRIRGDFSGASLALVAADGTAGTAVPWASLKDQNGEPVPTSSTDYVDVAIDHALSGITGEYAGILLASTTEMDIRTWYASNLQSRVAYPYAPSIDLSTASYLNDFEFTYTKGGWPTAYSNAPEELAAHGIDYVVNWNDAEGVSFDGHNMVLPATNGSYSNFFIGAKNPEPKDYMVVVAKAEDGADFNNFRFRVGGNSGETYYKSGIADYGYPTADFSTVDENGYTWMVFSTNENDSLKKENVNGEINLYWSHTEGQILIDSIFFADAAAPELGEKSSIGAPGSPAGGYLYIGYVSEKARILTLEITGGAGGGDTSNVAIEQEGLASKYLKDGALIGKDGTALEPQAIAEGETITLEIDLEKSGFDITKAAHYHGHFNDIEGLPTTGNISLAAYETRLASTETQSLLSEPLSVSMGGEYAYISGYDVRNQGDILRLKIHSDTAREDALVGFRIEFQAKGEAAQTLYFNAGQLKGTDGSAIGMGLEEGENVLEIDLAKSGIAYGKLTNIHLHGGDAAYASSPCAFTIEEMSLVRTDGLSGRYVGELSGMVTDFTGPTVTIAPEASNYEVGDTVSFTVVAEDETTASEDILLDIEVTYGSGDTFEVIEAENNSFVAEKAGDYTVTVTATDEFGNETIESITITVSEASSPVDPDDSGSASTPSTSKPDASTSEPGPSDPVDEPAGLEPGAIAGIVIGAIAGVAVIGFLVWFFLLRKKK